MDCEDRASSSRQAAAAPAAAAPAGGGAAVSYFSVADLVWFHDAESPTDPDPTPGVVTADEGESGYTVEITLADHSTRTVKHVGAAGPGENARYIEPRDREIGVEVEP